jgi:8-amino-7-oxononanoate synthase
MTQDNHNTVNEWVSQMNAGGRDIFQKAYAWDLVDNLKAGGFYPYFQCLDENQGPIALYQGREVIMLGSNNYLGLTTHPRVREASREAISRYGTGMTGSRFLNGTIKLHEELEAKLAKFLGKPEALVFTTGYQANLGVLTALVNDKAAAFIDRFAHASIHDGCKLMDGESIKFQHNDLADLEAKLAALPEDKGGLIFIDGVYSMEGDLAPLPEIVALAKKYNMRLAVDDAHGLGVLGPGGRGTTHHFGVENDVDLIVGTFSKSLAATGGFVAGDHKVINFIRHFGRPMIFSASLTPANTAAASAALDVLIEEPGLAVKARQNALWMKEGLTRLGFKTGSTDAAIIPIHIGDVMVTFYFWKMLLEAGVYTNPVLYPAVKKGEEMLRTSYLATQTEAQLEKALEIFRNVGQSCGVIPRTTSQVA